MKKLFTLSALTLSLVGGIQAQNRGITRSERTMQIPTVLAPSGPSSTSVNAIVYDTLRPGSYDLACFTATYYNYNNHGGYLLGTNQYNDLEKAERFVHAGNFTVKSVFIAFSLYTNASTPNINAVAYQVNGTEVDTSTRVLSDPVPLSSIDTSGNYTQFTFTTTAGFTDAVIVGYTIPDGSSGDTINGWTTPAHLYPADRAACTSGDSLNPTAYERESDGTYNSFYQVYGTSGDLLIIPVIQFDDAVATLPLMAAETRVYPVPASKSLSVFMPANLKGQANWTLTGMDGKVAQQGSHSGSDMFFVPRAELSGVYMLRINTLAGPITKRVVFAN